MAERAAAIREHTARSSGERPDKPTLGRRRSMWAAGMTTAPPGVTLHEPGAGICDVKRDTDSGIAGVILRACNCGGTCCSGHEDELVMRAGDGVSGTVPAVASRALGQAGRGQPLEVGIRGQMESAFGRDLSNVRIHRDDDAASAARVLEARAFTVGDDIFFSRGSWAPDTDDGRELLGHELAHVVQNAVGPVSAIAARTDELVVASPLDPLEAQAREAGRRIRIGEIINPAGLSVGHRPALVHSPIRPMIAMQTDDVAPPAGPMRANASFQPNPTSPDYQQGYIDAATVGGGPNPGVRSDQALADYNAGFAAGMGTLASAPAPSQPNKDTADYKAGMHDAIARTGADSGNRSGQAEVDYSAGYARGIYLNQEYDSWLAEERLASPTSWPNTAEALNIFSWEDMSEKLSLLEAGDIAKIHQGALDNPRLGPASAVARATELPEPSGGGDTVEPSAQDWRKVRR
jgi:Domain of unknown function (DUF4157)